MAESVGGIYYTIEVDTKQLIDAERTTNKSAGKMATSLTAVAQASRDYAAAAGSAATAARAAAKADDDGALSATKAAKAKQDEAKASAAAAAAAQKEAEARKKATKADDDGAMSAKALAAAKRNIPAQVTDIVTGLSTGQNPLTVLLQQGGQLKDMFGGVLPAVRALGSYVAGLVTPFTLAAAAVGGLLYGFVKGQDEMAEFNRSLALSGNQSGASAAQLNSLSAQLGKLSDITRGQAAEGLNVMVQAGIQGEANLSRFTEAAIRMEKAGGQAVQRTAAIFRELARDPLDATLKLNEQVNFLTVSVYKQIKALQDQGKYQEAANVAQNAYADAVLQRTPKVMENLGYMERGWNAVKNAVKGAADALLGIGRTNTIEEMVASLDALVKKRDKILAGGPSQTNVLRAAQIDKEITAAREQLKVEADKQTAAKETAKLEADRQDQVQALAAFDQAGLQFLDRRAKMEREITVARELGVKAGLSDEAIQKRVAEIRKSYGVDSKSDAAQQYYQNLVATNADAMGKIDGQEKAELADNHKRMAEDSANAGTYAKARVEITKKYARERLLAEEQTAQDVAELTIAMTTDQEAKIEAIRVEAYRRADAMEAIDVKNHEKAVRAKTAADFTAAQQRIAIAERLSQTLADNNIASTVDEIKRIDLIRQEAIRRADASKANGASDAQIRADKERAAIDAQNAIRQQVTSINPLAQLENEYQQKLAIVKYYETQMAQAGVDGATFVEQKRTELAYQYQQQRLAIAETEFAAQSATNKVMIDSLNSLGSTATSSIVGLINHTTTAQEAMKSLANVILSEAVGSLVQIGVQYIKNALIGQAADKALLATKAANAALYTSAIAAQVAVTTSLAAQSAFAATAAIPIVGPVLAPGAALAAGAAAAALGAPAVTAAPLAGARQYGGPVAAGSLYRINEGGRPEMFTASNGSQYMMPTKAGRVTPANEVGGGKAPIVIIENHGAPLQVQSQDYDQQSNTVRLAVATVASQIRANRGEVWTSLTGSSNVRSAGL